MYFTLRIKYALKNRVWYFKPTRGKVKVEYASRARVGVAATDLSYDYPW